MEEEAEADPVCGLSAEQAPGSTFLRRGAGAGAREGRAAAAPAHSISESGAQEAHGHLEDGGSR